MESSGILAAGTNSVLDNIIVGVDQADLAVTDEVTTGSKVNGFYFSCFFIAEGGEISNEVPLVDWYIIKNPSSTFASTFDATHLPTPGAQGSNANKKFIIHSEKGLTGGGDASLAGVPMIFKGVIVIPRGYRRIGVNDKFQFVARANFATKFYMQAIYKWFS